MTGGVFAAWAWGMVAAGGMLALSSPVLAITLAVMPAARIRAGASPDDEPFNGDTDLHLVEGPDRYSGRDVALGRRAEARSLPAGEWLGAYRKLGFSDPAAKSYAAMTKVTIEGEFPSLEETERGATSLQSYIDDLASRSAA